MKLKLTFTLDTDVPTEDYNDADLVARAKADAIIIQTLGATGYRLKLADVQLIKSNFDEFLNDIRNILAQ